MVGSGPGPAILVAKGYASLSLFVCLYVLGIGEKGPFFKECQWFRKKGYPLRHFHWKRVIF